MQLEAFGMHISLGMLFRQGNSTSSAKPHWDLKPNSATATVLTKHVIGYSAREMPWKLHSTQLELLAAAQAVQRGWRVLSNPRQWWPWCSSGGLATGCKIIQLWCNGTTRTGESSKFSLSPTVDSKFHSTSYIHGLITSAGCCSGGSARLQGYLALLQQHNTHRRENTVNIKIFASSSVGSECYSLAGCCSGGLAMGEGVEQPKAVVALMLQSLQTYRHDLVSSILNCSIYLPGPDESQQYQEVLLSLRLSILSEVQCCHKDIQYKGVLYVMRQLGTRHCVLTAKASLGTNKLV